MSRSSWIHSFIYYQPKALSTCDRVAQVVEWQALRLRDTIANLDEFVETLVLGEAAGGRVAAPLAPVQTMAGLIAIG